LLLGAALLVCLSNGPATQADSVPDWLTAANHIDLGHLGDGKAAVIVGDWTNFAVDASGRFVQTERRAIRILNRRSAEPYLTAVGHENNEMKVQSIQTWTIAPSGHVFQSAKKDMVTAAEYPGFELFSDDRVKAVLAPGAEDGSLVGYEIVTQGRSLISGNIFEMEEMIPIRQRELHDSVPSGSIRWFIIHPDRVEVSNQSATEATFRTANRPGIADEANAPPFNALAAQVVVNFDSKGSFALQTWEEAGRINHEFYTDAEKPGPEIETEVETLIAGKSDELSKIEALYNFVSRQIRYVAVEVGIGGYQPHPAIDVYKNKYGDCKDKSTLLVTMLGHIGLRSYTTLVGTRGDVEADPSAPTLTTFDHVIVALPVPDRLRAAVEKFASYDPKSQILWIDPTSETDPLGEVPEMDQGVFALITYPDHGDLKRIPEIPPEQNGTRYTARVRLQPDGKGTADITVDYLGSYNSEMHNFYRGLSQDQIQRHFEERVARYVTEADFQRASISGVDDSRQQVAEKFTFTGDFSLASSGDSWFFQPLFLSGMSVPEVGPKPRQLPLDLGSPERIHGEYRIELPAGMRVESLPNKNSIKSEFGEMEVEYSLSGNILTATHTLSFTESRIPPEKYMEFRDFVNSSLRAEAQRLRIVKVSPPEDLPPVSR
jgi:hypothetical protein